MRPCRYAERSTAELGLYQAQSPIRFWILILLGRFETGLHCINSERSILKCYLDSENAFAWRDNAGRSRLRSRITHFATIVDTLRRDRLEKLD